MPESRMIKAEYSVLVCSLSSAPEADYTMTEFCITGISDEDTAIDVMNQWIDEAVERHNKDPRDQADPCKYYAKHGIKHDSSWPTGYIYYLEDGKQHNVARLYISASAPYVPGRPLPQMERVSDM